MKILLIDHHDSFTYNLLQGFRAKGAEVRVRMCDEISPADIKEIRPDGIVFSPGPGRADIETDCGASWDIFRRYQGKIPMLGVCLGHQMIAYLCGAQLRQTDPKHGVRENILLRKREGLFDGLPQKIEGMRYHSWIVDRATLPPSFQITAENAEGLIMAIENSAEGLWGVQFHPESIGTPLGGQILRNFLEMAKRH